MHQREMDLIANSFLPLQSNSGVRCCPKLGRMGSLGAVLTCDCTFTS